MTEASARMIAAILRGTPTPDGVAPAVGRAMAYKTGTSYGFRDALALGYSGRYTVAVWVGRTDGTPRPGSYGRNTAAPLLFHIFDLLPPEPILLIAAQPSAGGHAHHVGAALKRFIPSADVVSTAANREAPPRIAASVVDLAHRVPVTQGWKSLPSIVPVETPLPLGSATLFGALVCSAAPAARRAILKRMCLRMFCRRFS
jgi:membrane peptidoglycan carboxypeptidase